MRMRGTYTLYNLVDGGNSRLSKRIDVRPGDLAEIDCAADTVFDGGALAEPLV